MRETWNRIECWLRAHAPLLRAKLAPAAEPADLLRMEDFFGCSLPQSFRDSLSTHDGQTGTLPLVVPWMLFAAKDTISEATRMRDMFSDLAEEDNHIETRGPVKNLVWSNAWVPFADEASGNLLALDGDPDDGGQRWQVIHWASDPPYVEVVAPDYRSWLAQFADDLEAGKLEWRSPPISWSRR